MSNTVAAVAAVAGCLTRVMTTCFTDGLADCLAEFCKLRQVEGKLHKKSWCKSLRAEGCLLTGNIGQ